MSDTSAPKFLRTRDCIAPRGPISRSAFYRYVRSGALTLRNIGPHMSFVEGVGTTDELIDVLSRKLAAE